MDNGDSNEQKEIINNNIESQSLEPLNNNNKEGDNDTPNKIVLKKNVRKIIPANANNKNENENEEKENEIEFEQKIEINNINEMNSEQMENNNDYNEMKIDINDENNNEKKEEIEINELKDDNNNEKKEEDVINELKDNNKKEEGYLDSDLEDEDNKKLYLRVIKRMEKTYSVPIIHAKIPGEPIEDIDLETNIRPILINNENKNINNKKNNEIPKQPISYINKYSINNNYKDIRQERYPKNNYKNQYINPPNHPYNNLYESYNKTKGISQYNNNYPTYCNNYNYNSNSQKKYYNNNPNNYNVNKYVGNPSLYTKYQHHRYHQINEPKNIKNEIPSKNIYPTSNSYSYLNSKILQYKTPTKNVNSPKYESPYLSMQKRKNEIPKYVNQINNNPKYNTRYQGNVNSKITNNDYKNNSPSKNRNLKDLNNSYNINDGLLNHKRNTELNKIKQTYYINSNAMNKNNNNYGSNINNRYNYSLNKNSTPIDPKRPNILNNKDNKIKNINRYSSLSSYLSKYKKNNNMNNNVANQKKIIPMNKSQQTFNIKKNNINSINNINNINNSNNDNNNNYGKNKGLLDRTKDIINNSKKSPFNSLQSYQINYYYANGQCNPQRKTYAIDSRYYH